MGLAKAKDNPFSTDRVLRIRYRPLQGTFDDILARLEQLQFRAAIIGPEGSGKTTLLEDLQRHFEQQGLRTITLKLNRSSWRFGLRFLKTLLRVVSSEHFVFLDGAEQMSWLGKRYFLYRTRNTKGVVATSHYCWVLPTLIECRTTAGLLEDILQELIEGKGKKTELLAKYYYKKHSGNLREALREMYDRFPEL